MQSKLVKIESRSAIMDLTCLAVFLGFMFTFFLGDRPFSTPDEGRYVEIPREMAVSGDYLTPRLNGLAYFEKPALFYWMQAAMIKAFGIDPFTMRLLPALFALLGCLVTYLMGYLIFSRRAGILAALLLGSSLLYFALAHVIILDMVVSILMTKSLYCFLLGMAEGPSLKRRLFAYASVSFLALAALTKGLMCIFIFLMIGLLWATVARQWHRVRPLYLPSAFLLFLAIYAPWHVLVGLKNPDFFEFYFIHEHILRYLTNVHGRTQPFWFFIPVLLVGFMPWTCFLALTLKHMRPGKDFFSSFLWIWVLFVLIFFSIGDSKLIPYILPAFPPLALLTARAIDDSLGRAFPKWPFWVFSLSALALIAGYFGLRDLIPIEHAVALTPFIQALIIIFGISAFLVPLILAFKGPVWALYTMGLCWIAALFVISMAAPMAQRPSMEQQAAIIMNQDPTATVVSYGFYYQDLPVYLGKTIKVVNYTGELAFGHEQAPDLKILMDEQDFQNLWESEKVCVVFKEDHRPALLHGKEWLNHPYGSVVCNFERAAT